MDVFGGLSKFYYTLTDSSEKLSKRVTYLIFILLTIVVIDNTLSFSFYHNNDNKLDQLNKVNHLLEYESISENERLVLKELKKEILIRKTWKDYLYKFLTDFKFESNKSNVIRKRDETIHLITSSWTILLSMVWVFLLTVMNWLAKEKDSLNFFQLLIVLSILVLSALIQSKIFSLIPLIFNLPIINYIINVISSLLMAWINYKFVFHIDKINRKKEAEIEAREMMDEMDKTAAEMSH